VNLSEVLVLSDIIAANNLAFLQRLKPTGFLIM